MTFRGRKRDVLSESRMRYVLSVDMCCRVEKGTEINGMGSLEST